MGQAFIMNCITKLNGKSPIINGLDKDFCCGYVIGRGLMSTLDSHIFISLTALVIKETFSDQKPREKM